MTVPSMGHWFALIHCPVGRLRPEREAIREDLARFPRTPPVSLRRW